MKWRNGLIGIELMATIGLGAFYGLANLRGRADRHRLTQPCGQFAGCGGHRIGARMPKFGSALLALAAVNGLLVPYAALTGRTGRSGVAATATAASSLALALGLRYEFVRIDQQRRDHDNAKANLVLVIMPEPVDGEDDFLDEADCRDDDRHPEWTAAA